MLASLIRVIAPTITFHARTFKGNSIARKPKSKSQKTTFRKIRPIVYTIIVHLKLPDPISAVVAEREHATSQQNACKMSYDARKIRLIMAL